MLGLPELIRFRRMLGLFAFFYGCLHFTTYIWLDKFFDLAEMWRDVSKRPYITVGFLGVTLLIPLAVTSTAGWIRRLGGRTEPLSRRSCCGDWPVNSAADRERCQIPRSNHNRKSFRPKTYAIHP
jgi:Ferric reductase like transmembrane component